MTESFNKKKQLLRQTYKQFKVGLIKWEEIDEKTQGLLIRYYGVQRSPTSVNERGEKDE